MTDMVEERLNLHTQHFSALISRITLLEDRVKNLADSIVIILNEHLARIEAIEDGSPMRKEIDPIEPFSYTVYITFQQAWKAYLKGKRIRRKSWSNEHDSLALSNGSTIELTPEDIAAIDWFIV